MIDLLIFAGALSILVLIHEFGHYLAAVKTGVWVEEFGLGLPPRAWGKKIGKTIFSLNWLPIGGFCKMYGEDPTSEVKRDGEGAKPEEAFVNKKPWQKMIIILGGVTMNLVLAVAIFTLVYAITGLPVTTDRVKVLEVNKNSPAETAGIKEGMWIYKVNEVVVAQADELTKEVAKYKGETVKLTIRDEMGERVIPIEVRENPPAGEGSMGVMISNVEVQPMKWWQLPRGVAEGFKEAYFWGSRITEGLIKTISQMYTERIIPSDVAGPIGMFQATSTIKRTQGLLGVMHFFGLVSVNLAVVNILPFPALDGGRLLFVAYEMVFKKRANEKVEAMVNNIGMMILLLLVLLITVGDVARLVRQ
ncbi:MAG: M50 family metallopeptidase [Candidatus Shapirobacteria bacterium]|jgi:regulator of sigma E protease